MACYFWVQKVEGEHAEHQKHLMAENDGHLPFPPDYEYLNVRAKPFPWGANSLFFNSHVRSRSSDRFPTSRLNALQTNKDLNAAEE